MRKWLTATVFAALVGLEVVWVTGCSTITPKPVEAAQVGWDGGSQDAGLLDAGHSLASGSFHVSAGARAKYNALIGLGYGKLFLPAIRKDFGVVAWTDGTFAITKEAMADFATMNKHRKSGIPPP